MAISRKWISWLIVTVMAALLTIAVIYLPPVVHRYLTRSAVASFRNHPSEQTALPAIKLLKKRELSSQEGNEMLRLMTKPVIAKRDSYRLGGPVYVQYSVPFDARFGKTLSTYSSWSIIGGLESPSRIGSSGNGFTAFPNGINLVSGLRDGVLRKFDQPGKYEVTIEFGYQLIPQNYKEETKGIPFVSRGTHVDVKQIEGAKPVYECTHRVPLEISILPEAQAEKVVLDGTPATTAAVMKTITTAAAHSVAGGSDRQVEGGMVINFDKPPCDIAMHVIIRDANGMELKDGSNGSDFVIRAGKQANRLISGRAFISQPLGTYNGTVEIVTDENLAYSNPDIKKVWQGKLTFPMTVTVKSSSNAAASTKP